MVLKETAWYKKNKNEVLVTRPVKSISKSMFSAEEKTQYSRHFLLDQIGPEGQSKLKNSKVLVVGAGGLGCPVLQYLTAAGVGTIGIVDPDTVERSNLQRQILYTVDDLGKSKAACAAKHLQQRNPFVKFNIHNTLLDSGNALALFEQYDIIADGSDNFRTRYLCNDAAVITQKPLVYGALYKFEGQVSVFNYKKGPTYRCLFPTPPKANSIPNCADIGVLGVLPGIVGCLQANELLKIICDLEGVLSGKLLSFNALTLEQRFLNFPKNNALKIDKLIDYEVFCGLQPSGFEITPENFNRSVSDTEYVLLDVRKEVERAQFHLEGMHIPLHELPQKIKNIAAHENIVVYCEVGQRSLVATRMILEKYPDKKVFSLQGGLQAWKKTNKQTKP